MGCTHPFGIERILNDEGEMVGGRCPACKAVAYVGDSTGRSFIRAFGQWIRSWTGGGK